MLARLTGFRPLPLILHWVRWFLGHGCLHVQQKYRSMYLPENWFGTRRELKVPNACCCVNCRSSRPPSLVTVLFHRRHSPTTFLRLFNRPRMPCIPRVSSVEVDLLLSNPEVSSNGACRHIDASDVVRRQLLVCKAECFRQCRLARPLSQVGFLLWGRMLARRPRHDVRGCPPCWSLTNIGPYASSGGRWQCR